MLGERVEMGVAVMGREVRRAALWFLIWSTYE
jgi:hypothetical protein